MVDKPCLGKNRSAGSFLVGKPKCFPLPLPKPNEDPDDEEEDADLTLRLAPRASRAIGSPNSRTLAVCPCSETRPASSLSDSDSAACSTTSTSTSTSGSSVLVFNGVWNGSSACLAVSMIRRSGPPFDRVQVYIATRREAEVVRRLDRDELRERWGEFLNSGRGLCFRVVAKGKIKIGWCLEGDTRWLWNQLGNVVAVAALWNSPRRPLQEQRG